MWRILAIVRRNLHNMRKSSRVIDADAYGGGRIMNEQGHAQVLTRDGGDVDVGQNPGLSMVCGVLIRAPLSILSTCFVHPHVSNRADGAWVSGDFARASEMNQLMVSDSIRYALLM
ncbi:hypothetical protein CRG98_015397 [Punica granatum]|uniref:Uncharacterized protein n=1 Tax=Punica granatum TaxID=22663 RepID=A0A2I0K7R6_PUNGR|nr:hypothetical protein CRG98_015397 [Punica granatum]